MSLGQVRKDEEVLGRMQQKFSSFRKYVDLKGPVTKAKNIKADTPKILRTTHFSGPKDTKAEKLVVGVIPWIFFSQSELSALIFGV